MCVMHGTVMKRTGMIMISITHPNHVPDPYVHYIGKLWPGYRLESTTKQKHHKLVTNKSCGNAHVLQASHVGPGDWKRSIQAIDVQVPAGDKGERQMAHNIHVAQCPPPTWCS